MDSIGTHIHKSPSFRKLDGDSLSLSEWEPKVRDLGKLADTLYSLELRAHVLTKHQ